MSILNRPKAYTVLGLTFDFRLAVLAFKGENEEQETRVDK